MHLLKNGAAVAHVEHSLQGSFKVLDSELLQPILNAEDLPVCSLA